MEGGRRPTTYPSGTRTTGVWVWWRTDYPGKTTMSGDGPLYGCYRSGTGVWTHRCVHSGRWPNRAVSRLREPTDTDHSGPSPRSPTPFGPTSVDSTYKFPCRLSSHPMDTRLRTRPSEPSRSTPPRPGFTLRSFHPFRLPPFSLFPLSSPDPGRGTVEGRRGVRRPS